MSPVKNKRAISEVFFLDYFNSLAAGDKNHCSEIVNNLLYQKVDIKDIYTELFQRALYRLGKLWDDGKLNIAEEHLATQITLQLINSYRTKQKKNKKISKRAIISCVDKEYHEIGARMVANIFEFNGWETEFLGASVPAKDIIKFIKLKNPDVVGLSFNFYMNLLKLYTVVDHIKKFFPDKKIIFGGQAASREKHNILKHFPDLLYFDSLTELDEFIKANSK